VAFLLYITYLSYVDYLGQRRDEESIDS
jgi:hypothetical protein